MLNFLNRKKRQAQEEEEPLVLSPEDQLKQLLTPEETAVYTKLSMPPAWKTSEEDYYSFLFHNQESKPLKPNQIAIESLHFRENEEKAAFTVFIRNGTKRALQLDRTELVLLNRRDQVIARKTFNLEKAGEIPPKSSRPWVLHLLKSELFTERIPQEDWRFAFQLATPKQTHTLDMPEAWKDAMRPKELAKFEEMVMELPLPEAKTIHVQSIRASFDTEGQLHASVLIRNGHSTFVRLESLILDVQNSEGETVAKAAFDLSSFILKTYSTKPWTFTFPKNSIKIKDADLDGITVIPVTMTGSIG